jgi:hypothetical protein
VGSKIIRNLKNAKRQDNKLLCLHELTPFFSPSLLKQRGERCFGYKLIINELQETYSPFFALAEKGVGGMST